MQRALIEEYERIHARETGKAYGTTGRNSLPCILPHILALRPGSLIDYGCGRSDLAALLARKAGIYDIARYEPAIPELAERPRRTFDVLVNIDVFEHIPDDEIDAAAEDMRSLARHAILVIDMATTGKTLRDGRSAHVSVHDQDWWLKRLSPVWPSLRPIEPLRPHRAAFKTWDEELPPLRHWAIARRELWARRLRRLTRSRFQAAS
jgi:hypothetical protein